MNDPAANPRYWEGMLRQLYAESFILPTIKETQIFYPGLFHFRQQLIELGMRNSLLLTNHHAT